MHWYGEKIDKPFFSKLQVRINHGGSGGSGGGSNASSVGNYHHSSQMGQMHGGYSSNSSMANNFNQQRYNWGPLMQIPPGFGFAVSDPFYMQNFF